MQINKRQGRMNRSLFKKRSPFLLVLLLLVVSSTCLYTVHGQEREQEQEQVCSEDDHTCHAKSDEAEAIPDTGEASDFSRDDFDDDDDDDDDDDFDGYMDDNIDGDDMMLYGDGRYEKSDQDDGDIEHEFEYEFDDDDSVRDDFDDDDFDGEDDPENEDEDLCNDNHPQCQEWSDYGECDKNPGYMLQNCAQSCRVCQSYGARYGERQNLKENLDNYDDMLQILDKMEKYMKEEIIENPELKYLEPRCKNRHKDCAFWSLEGECDINPSYMLTNCAPVCNTCHLLDFKVRCPIDPNAVNAMGPGDLNKMFERIVEGDDADVYNTKVLSRPSYPPGMNEGNADFKIGPWVVTIDDFLTENECKVLTELGDVEGYKRSEDVGKELFDGSFDSVQSSSRTSYNAWCQHECYDHPIAKDVMNKIEKITGIPEPNSENLQLLRYHEGQFYKVHHDYIDSQTEFPSGPRLLTAFLYLNDVEEGGGTNFPRLGITVHPKRGRLLLWPSVLDSDPNIKDGRTLHQALPVERGIKYAANGWIHLRDFKEPNGRNCT